MAKKTLASRYQQMDNARHIKRKLLYYGKDVQEICYEVEQKPEEPTQKPAPKKADVEPKKDTTAPPPPPPAATAPTPQSAPAAASHVDDVPVSARDIVMTIIAMKLKKSCEEIPLTKNIKQLVGGLFYHTLILTTSPTNRNYRAINIRE